MAENYTVNYNINVNSAKAMEALNAFQTATQKLTTVEKRLTTFQKKIDQTVAKFNSLSKKAPILNINTTNASRKLDTLIRKLERINTLAKQNRTITVATSARTNKRGTTAAAPAASQQAAPPATIIQSTRGRRGSAPKGKPRIPNNASYRALGPAMLDSGGIGALDMMKGMGIAYGITGLGALMGNVVRDATEYNNLIQTTKNILGSHDDKPNFDNRFATMERIIRSVGVATKFTAPQVADASKFLAMAGFDVQAINQSIRPIADIALVGDTDLGETADVVTNIMTGYGIKANDVRHAADVMTQTFTMSNTTLMEIAEAYKYSASLLAAGGISFEEATAGLGILGDAGIKGSQAGTTFRTIMANIVNPTKKQKKAWDRIGVARMDEQGNVRSLTDIFGDLANAGLRVEDFYKMFHRTAAQGAVALTAHVDKWNEVVKENFLSEGLAEDLADKKKNTIQGLWAQLTSMFTENGMRAFEALDKPIRQFLQETIDWLKTSEAENLIHSLGQTLLDIVKMLKDFTMVLVDMYNRFGPFMKMWLEWQLKLSAILIPLRMFRAMFNFGTFLVSGARQIGLLATQFSLLTTSVVGLTKTRSALSATWGTMARMGGGLFGVGPVGSGLGSSKFKNVSPEVLARYTRMQQHRIGNAVGVYGGGLAGMAGSMMGAYYGSELGEPGSSTSMLGTVGGMVAGGALGSIIGSKLAPWIATKAAPFLFTNPIGWGLAIAGGLSYGAYALYKYHESVDAANEANLQFLKSTQSINGISLSEHATMADKYLTIVYNKQMNANRAIGEHINLMREQLGIMSDTEKKYTGKLLSDSHKKEIENASAAWGLFGTDKEKRESVLTTPLLPDGSLDTQMRVLQQPYTGQNGSYMGLKFNGVDYGPGNNTVYSQISAARLLYSLGRDMSDGSPLSQKFGKFDKRLLMSAGLQDFNAVIKDIWDSTNAMEYLKGSTNWTLRDIKNMPDSQWKQGYHYIDAQKDNIFARYQFDRPETAQAKMFNTFVDILRKHDAGQEVSEEILSKFLLQNGIMIFNTDSFGKFGSNDFMKKFGWYDDKWNAGTYEFFNKDTGKMEKISVTAEEAREAFLLFHQQILDLTNRLHPKMRSYFNSFLNNPVWGYGGDGNGSNGTAVLDGVTWKWNPGDQKWHAVDGVGHSVLNPIDDKTMKERLSKTVGRNNTGGVTNIPGSSSTGNPGTDQSQYQSHYNNHNAAPKQVIVRIENLMNVESVDLANPDNAAVINSLKQQMTQALVEVVHDFDETWHG